MFNWFKKKELALIEDLRDAICIKNDLIIRLQADIYKLESKLSDAKKIANAKKVVKCAAKDCMDFEDGGCSLLELCIKTDGKEAFCMDYDNGSVMEELKAETRGKVSTSTVILIEESK